MNIISRGFGALQRIITRGFNSAPAISANCYAVFQSLITPDTGSLYVVLNSIIDPTIGVTGSIDATETTGISTLQPVIAFTSIVCECE